MRVPTAKLSFDTLHLEGGFLVPDVLEKAARGDLVDQKPGDYHLPRGLGLTDEYGRAFQIALAAWKAYQQHQNSLQFCTEFFRDCLGYQTIQATAPKAAGGFLYPIGHLATAHLPLVLAPASPGAETNLDTSSPAFAPEGGGSRKKSPFQLAQEFLNASSDYLWALVSDGRTIRLVRDSHTLVRPVWLEFDLATILSEERYADFKALWLVLHHSRAPKDQPNTSSWESWRSQGIEQGTRVRDGLRTGVTQALLTLGQGFLKTPGPGNLALINALQDGSLGPMAYYQEILRLVYRFLFLYTIEEQGFLHAGDPQDAQAARAQSLYRSGYSMARLRDRSLRHRAHDSHTDLWQGVQVVFAALNAGQSRLDLPALGGVFAPDQCPHLDAAVLDNHHLLAATRHLRWSINAGILALVDYKNMGPEEFGSVYESLLELVPVIDLSHRHFGFVGLGDDAGSQSGNARKTTGSYYTPDSLVQELIKSALDPVIESKLQGGAPAPALQPGRASATPSPGATPGTPEAALLSITVIDPSCGSGHFLLAAARRLAERLAQLRSLDGSVAPADYRHALREVIGHCIFGVDRNPMAVELARMALWLEGFEPGKALGFLDHHLQVGDSLLGLMDIKVLEKGVPDDAFKDLSGDDKELCSLLKKQNKASRASLEKWLKSKTLDLQTGTALASSRLLESMADDDTQGVAKKRQTWLHVLAATGQSPAQQAADVLVGAFLATKSDPKAVDTIPGTATLDHILTNQVQPKDHAAIALAQELCQKAAVFHWPLRFPQVFARGGFDVVLGNPPWERIKLQEEEFFASRHPAIATAKNKAERQKLIEALPQGNEYDQQLHQDFMAARRSAEATSVFAHVKGTEGGRYPLTGVGDVNTYALFAETILHLNARTGRAGFIVPSGIATDDSTKRYFGHLVSKKRLASLVGFDNEKKIFPAVHPDTPFSLVTLGNSIISIELRHYITNIEQLTDKNRLFTLSPDEFALLNPNTRTCPVFRSNQDAELTKKIYRQVPVLIKEAVKDAVGNETEPEQNPWGINFSTMFHMSGDSGLFQSSGGPGLLPLYEAKMIHQFDHRWATYQEAKRVYRQSAEGLVDEEDAGSRDMTDVEKADPAATVRPRYWVSERQVLARIAKVPKGFAKAWLEADPKVLPLVLAHWLFAAEAKSTHWEHLIAPWHQCCQKYPFMRDLAPTAMGLCTDAASTQQSSNTLPALSQNELSRTDKRSPPLYYLIDEVKAAAWQKAYADYSLPSGPTWDAAVAVKDPARLADSLMDLTSPRWLMGWRDITNATNERTVIASVVPRAPIGNKIPLMIFGRHVEPTQAACLLGDLNALVHDFVARQKIGGTTLNYFIYKQIVALPPSAYSPVDLVYLVPRVLELTYTAHDLEPWARDVWNSLDTEGRQTVLQRWHEVGGPGADPAPDPSRLREAHVSLGQPMLRALASAPGDGVGRDLGSAVGEGFPPLPFGPFPWNPERRALVRAELDARYARLYGLTRDELRYILDPAAVMGADYPSETFRVLKNKEQGLYGEYRTQRLVLAAWDGEEYQP